MSKPVLSKTATPAIFTPFKTMLLAEMSTFFKEPDVASIFSTDTSLNFPCFPDISSVFTNFASNVLKLEVPETSRSLIAAFSVVFKFAAVRTPLMFREESTSSISMLRSLTFSSA